jgi:hypothetical protein
MRQRCGPQANSSPWCAQLRSPPTQIPRHPQALLISSPQPDQHPTQQTHLQTDHHARSPRPRILRPAIPITFARPSAPMPRVLGRVAALQPTPATRLLLPPSDPRFMPAARPRPAVYDDPAAIPVAATAARRMRQTLPSFSQGSRPSRHQREMVTGSRSRYWATSSALNSSSPPGMTGLCASLHVATDGSPSRLTSSDEWKIMIPYVVVFCTRWHSFC